MNFEQFIHHANQLGNNRTPFLFIIDFEQQKPLIMPLEQAKQAGVHYDITFDRQQLTNFDNTKIDKVDKNGSDIELQTCPIDSQTYRHAFEQVQHELQHGNTYLLNLTFATSIDTNADFEQIFYQSQAKYKLWLKDKFICFSPECFVEIKNNQIFTYPMKGTIDATLPDAEQQLLDSEKEKREHYTIVDLLRNDLSLVATDVKVTQFRYVESITTQKGKILQTSSQITGNLDNWENNWQANIGSILAKLLPAGSICGAPKQKTVEIIKQVEGQPRGYYTGIFGIFLGESLTSAVTIRYIEKVDEHFYFRSGGGITTLSECQQEYDELIKKVYLPFINNLTKNG